MIVVLLLAAAPGWAAEIYDFDVLSGAGQISGVPGETIGWGYSLTNQSSSRLGPSLSRTLTLPTRRNH